MNLRIFETTDELNKSLAEFVVDIARQAIASKGRFDFVLTGGSSPKVLYQSLASIHKDQVDWTKVFFFIGDERNVPSNHKDYNGLMAKETLFDNLNISADHIFLVDTALPPEEAAKAYEEALNGHFAPSPIVFDLILLGMGDDAHTASIFPGTDLVKSYQVGVSAVWVDKLDSFRISLTAPLINKAKNIAFIAYGDNKANALKHVIGDEVKDYDTYPAQLIKPETGTLTWFVDEKATSWLDIKKN